MCRTDWRKCWIGKDGYAKATLTFHVNSIKLHGKSNGSATGIPVVPMVTTPAAMVADDLPF